MQSWTYTNTRVHTLTKNSILVQAWPLSTLKEKICSISTNIFNLNQVLPGKWREVRNIQVKTTITFCFYKWIFISALMKPKIHARKIHQLMLRSTDKMGCIWENANHPSNGFLNDEPYHLFFRKSKVSFTIARGNLNAVPSIHFEEHQPPIYHRLTPALVKMISLHHIWAWEEVLRNLLLVAEENQLHPTDKVHDTCNSVTLLDFQLPRDNYKIPLRPLL